MYQMGFAQGFLLKDELHQFLGELWKYIEEQIEDVFPKKMPAFLKEGASSFAMGAALDLNY